MAKELYFSLWYNFRFGVSEVSLEAVGLALNLQGFASTQLVWNLSQSIWSSWLLMTGAVFLEVDRWVMANKHKDWFPWK